MEYLQARIGLILEGRLETVLLNQDGRPRSEPPVTRHVVLCSS